ncbi:MAG: glycosyltransferase, partial [Thermomicrobium sp.]|nr:glycosyltransferase [Thermomicrobium sp.]
MREGTDRKRLLLLRLLLIVIGLYVLYYVVWRAAFTLNPEALVFAVVLLAAEAWGVLNLFFFMVMTWETGVRPRFVLREGLTVDVLVTTYDEPLEVLEATLSGCQQIRYPHTTYVLDDGRRPEVEALAARLGCRYLTRPDNRHGKAGNINAALPRTEGEFIALLDADMIPQPDFLDQTLGYFVDDRVALVQCPQEFYNLDSFQHAPNGRGPRPWHEQSLFFRVIQPGKNRWNAAFWCGSPSVVRRAALESVGGVAHSITEDILTSLRLHARGWRTVYHEGVVAYGIAPQTYRAFTVQRLRWAQGAMRILRSRENPLIVRGLSLAQRLNYLGSMLTYFDGFQKLAFLFVPVAMLWFGWMPVRADGWLFFGHWILYFVGSYVAATILGRGWFRIGAVERFNALRMLTFVRAAFTLVLPARLRFRVTPKQFVEDERSERRAALPLLLLTLLTGGSCLIGGVRLIGVLPSDAPMPLLLAATFWAGANAVLLASAVGHILRRRYRRAAYRFPVGVPAQLQVAGHGPLP